MHEHFSKDDEGLLEILANMAGVILRNNLHNDKQLVFQNNLRNILKVKKNTKYFFIIVFYFSKELFYIPCFLFMN